MAGIAPRPPPPPPPKRGRMPSMSEEEVAAIEYAAQKKQLLNQELNRKKTARGPPPPPRNRIQLGTAVVDPEQRGAPVTMTEDEAAAIARSNISRLPSRSMTSRDRLGGPKPPPANDTVIDQTPALATSPKDIPNELDHNNEIDYTSFPLEEAEKIDADAHLSDIDDTEHDSTLFSKAAELVDLGKRRMTVVQQDAFRESVDIERKKSEHNRAMVSMKRVDSLDLFDAASATVIEGSKRLSIQHKQSVVAAMEASITKEQAKEEKTIEAATTNGHHKDSARGDHEELVTNDSTNGNFVCDDDDSSEKQDSKSINYDSGGTGNPVNVQQSNTAQQSLSVALEQHREKMQRRRNIIRRVARKRSGNNAMSFSINPGISSMEDKSNGAAISNAQIKSTARYLRAQQSRIASRLHKAIRRGNMSMVDKLTARMKAISGDLIVVLDRSDEATVGAAVASLNAGSGTSRRNNLPPHRVGAKWLEEIRQQAVVRRDQELQEQFEEGTVRAQSTLSPMLTASQIRARWGSATVVGRGGFGRLGNKSAVSALELEGAVRRVMPRPSIGTHALYKSSPVKQMTRPHSAMQQRLSVYMATDESGRMPASMKQKRRGRTARRRPLSASMLGLADRRDDGANNNRVVELLRKSKMHKMKPSLHVPMPVPLSNPESSSKFGGHLPGHARFEELQRQGSALLEGLRRELRETRDDGIHTDGGNRLQDPAVGISARKLGKLYNCLYEGVHGSLNLMMEHLNYEESPKKAGKLQLDSVREKKSTRRRRRKRRPKSAVNTAALHVTSGNPKSTTVHVDEDDDDGVTTLLDGDDLSGIKNLRGSRAHKRRPRTAGMIGIRERHQRGFVKGHIITERNICAPTKSNSIDRETRREMRLQAAIDKYRQYEYTNGAPRVERGQNKGVFRVYKK
eukprot:g3560.t1